MKTQKFGRKLKPHMVQNVRQLGAKCAPTRCKMCANTFFFYSLKLSINKGHLREFPSRARTLNFFNSFKVKKGVHAHAHALFF